MFLLTLKLRPLKFTLEEDFGRKCKTFLKKKTSIKHLTMHKIY